MRDPVQPASAHRGLDRRGFLSLAAGSLGGAALTGVAAASSASAQPRPPGFALLGDTHVGLTVPQRTDWVSWVYDHIAARDAAAVCHVGDIMDYGSVDEYDLYLSTVPDELWPRLHHVPGNHEWRWDPTARERYHELLGATRYSFDAAGIRFIALNPSHLLQEGGGFGEHGMAWLVDELDQAPQGAPIILLCHFPFGFDNYYVSDQQRLLDVLYSYNVRAVFAGHIHNEQVHRFNGITQLAVNGSLGAPLYYWLEREVRPGGPVLKVTEVRRGPDDDVMVREVTTIPLGGPRIAGHERPQAIELEPAGASLAVSVRLRPPAAGSIVEAQLYPQHTYAVKNPGQWRVLEADGSGRRYGGDLDLSGLPAGEHRMTVKVTGSHGDWYEETRGFSVPGADRVRWRTGLGAPVQAGLATNGDLLVAATTGGTVVAGTPSSSGLDEVWRRELTGGVKGRPAFSPDGGTVYVPSVDHRVHALDAQDGSTRFTYDAGEPVLGSPLVAELAGTPAVVVGSGQRIHALDAVTGDRLWAVDDPGMFVGRPATDGTRVYTGGGNANSYALDAGTGEVVWSFVTNTRESAYRRLIYGPWYDNLELLPGGLVLVSTVTTAHALHADSGEQRWALSGSYIFAPKVLLDPDLLVIDDWARTVSRLDPSDGTVRWTTDIGVRALNTGAAVHDGIAWVHGTTGQVTGVDVTDGSIVERVQVTATANCYSSPAVAGGTLVVGDQDGVLHGLAVG